MPEPDSNADVRLTASEAIAAANDRGRITRRPRAKDSDPARRLVDYFLDQWADAVGLSAPLATVRGPESRGEMTGYVRATFIAPSAGRSYTEDEVRALIDDFVKAAVRGTAGIKQGQSAWRRFTGWWGRHVMAPTADAGEYFRLTQRPDPA